MAIAACATVVRMATRDCGHNQVTIHRCHSIICADCLRYEVSAILRRYGEWLGRMVRPVFLTLTLRDVSDEGLHDGFRRIHDLYHRFLDFRLGPRAMTRMKKLLDAALVTSNLSPAQKELQLAIWSYFEARVTKVRKKTKNLKLRHLIYGLARLEVTYDRDWHIHIHALMSGSVIPQVLISALWSELTGDSYIVDIRATRKNVKKELVKYTTKPWEIPKEKHALLLEATKDVKRTWTFGQVVDSPPDKVCPACGSPSCKARYYGKGDLDVRLDRQALRELRRGRVVQAWVRAAGALDRVDVYIDEDGHLSWRIALRI